MDAYLDLLIIGRVFILMIYIFFKAGAVAFIYFSVVVIVTNSRW